MGRGEGDLGVRDDTGREKCVGGIAEAALHPADNQRDLPHCRLDMAGIAPMPHKAAVAEASAMAWVRAGTQTLVGVGPCSFSA